MLYPEEPELWDADLLQISVYHSMTNCLEIMRQSAAACRDAGTPFVIHPVGYSLLKKEMYNDLREMAELSDLALVLHDERTPEGGRLDSAGQRQFRDALDELGSLTRVSIENSADSADIHWFWDRFASSVTLDIGHVESSGLDSVRFVEALLTETVNKLQFVHIHRNNGLHGGITDHWPITPDCREVTALKVLLGMKPDVSVILEINEVDEIDNCLQMLADLRDSTVR